MRIIGIDPGLHLTGYGVLDETGGEVALVEAGVIRTDRRQSIGERLKEIGASLSEILDQFKPEVMAVEELYSHYAHPKTAIIMGHARGVIFLKAGEVSIPIVVYAATRIKKSLTGNGRASKTQVQQMIRSTLRLTELPEPADAADALAIALCHALSYRQAGVLA